MTTELMNAWSCRKPLSVVAKALQQAEVTTILKTLSLIWLAYFLTACSILSKSEPPALSNTQHDWQEIRADLNDIQHWELIGKIGVRTPEDSFTAAINNWTQDRSNFILNLSSTFFGLGATKLSGNSQYLLIEESGEQPLGSYEPDLLVAEALGFPLPLTSLLSWVKGLPAPNQKFELDFNERGLPKQLIQNGWRLSYSKYHLVQGTPLPGKIKLERDQVRIILAIKQWTLL